MAKVQLLYHPECGLVHAYMSAEKVSLFAEYNEFEHFGAVSGIGLNLPSISLTDACRIYGYDHPDTIVIDNGDNGIRIRKD